MNHTDKVLKEFDERYFVLNSGQIILQKDIKEGVINPADTIDDIKSFITTALTQAYRRGVKEACDYIENNAVVLQKGSNYGLGSSRWGTYEVPMEVIDKARLTEAPL